MHAMTIVLDRGHKAKLLQIAARCGAVAPSGWMKGNPSISELIRQIADGKLKVEIADAPTMDEPEPVRPSTDMTPERAWSFVEAVWQSSKNDADTFRKTLVGMPTVTAIWPLDCDRVQKLISD